MEQNQKLLHVNHLDYEDKINPLLNDNWVIIQIQPDGHNGLWVLLHYYKESSHTLHQDTLQCRAEETMQITPLFPGNIL